MINLFLNSLIFIKILSIKTRRFSTIQNFPAKRNEIRKKEKKNVSSEPDYKL